MDKKSKRKGLRRAVDMSPPSALRFTPYRPGRTPTPLVTDLFDLGVVRLWLWTENGKLVDFLLKHEVEEDDGIVADVVKVDCCDDEVHIHRYDADGEEVTRTTIRPIYTQDDVVRGLDDAKGLVYERWQENHGRWERGR